LKARHRHFSYRFLATKIGFKSPALLTLVLQGKRNISPRFLARFSESFKLGRREAAHFELLVGYNQAKTHEEKKRCLDKLMWAKGSGAKVLQPQQYAFCDQWYHGAIREYIAVAPFTGDFAALGKALVPPISPAEAKKSVDLLADLGLITVGPGGIYRRTEATLTTGESWRSLAVQHFQRQMFGLARDAFDRIPKEERDLSSMTLSCSWDTLEAIREKIRTLRREIADLAAGDAKPEGVFQCNFQVFPLTRDGRGPGHKSRETSP
jgi:uncharacterized protein (TIGR02147 family)